MAKSKTRIIICGATGFIGRNILENFAKNRSYNIVAVYNKRPKFFVKNVKWKKVDLLDTTAIKKLFLKNDIVIQAAATTSGSKDIVNKPFIHVTDNAVMNSLILRAGYEKKISKLIFFSCTVMYQSSKRKLKEIDFDANENIHPNYFGVGWTKVYIEKMCQFYSRLGDTKYTVIRHSNIYGEHDKYDLKKSHVFGASITKVMKARNEVVIWGKGLEKRDLLYVGDLVDFVNKSIKYQKNKFELVNVGLGKAISIKDLVNLIVKKSGKKLEIKHDLSQPSIPTYLSLNIDKARKVFKWKPSTSIESGIIKSICWWKLNLKKRNL